MSEIRVGGEAFLTKCGCHPDFHRKKKRLRHGRIRQIPRGIIRCQHGRKIPSRQGTEIGVRFFDSRGKDWVRREQRPAHTNPLAAVSGIHPRGLRGPQGVAPQGSVFKVRGARCQRTKRRQGLFNRPGFEVKAVREMFPLMKERCSRPVKRCNIGPRKTLRQPLCRPRQAFAAFCRHEQGEQAIRRNRYPYIRRPILLQHHVRVRAAEPEGIQTHQRSACHSRKLLRLNGHAKPQPRKINRRIRRFQVNVARNFAFFKHTERFCESRHPGRGFKVSEIRFDASHEKRRFTLTVPQHFPDRPCFNGIPRLRTSTVRFHVGNARFREFLAVNPCHQRRLRLPVR